MPSKFKFGQVWSQNQKLVKFTWNFVCTSQFEGGKYDSDDEFKDFILKSKFR